MLRTGRGQRRSAGLTLVVAGATALALLLTPSAALARKTLDAVKARGEVICGVNTSAPGFSAKTIGTGTWPDCALTIRSRL